IEVTKGKTGIGGKMVVKKQRDLETGGLGLEFRLNSVEIGTDSRGNIVKSCYAHVYPAGSTPFEAIDLTEAEGRLLRIGRKIISERSTAAQSEPLSTKEWDAEAARQWGKTGNSGTGGRDTFRKHRKKLEEKGWAKKASKGQWHILRAEERKNTEQAQTET